MKPVPTTLMEYTVTPWRDLFVKDEYRFLFGRQALMRGHKYVVKFIHAQMEYARAIARFEKDYSKDIQIAKTIRSTEETTRGA